jgi:HSP20 family protein
MIGSGRIEREVITMTLVRWEPMRELVTLQDRINRMFTDTLFRPLPGEEDGQGFGTWSPYVDVLEDSESLVIKAELPEMDLKDIDVKIVDDLLTIRGERKIEKEDKRENYHKIERSYGSFSRSFTLPAYIDQEKIKATYDRGVLRLVLPKKEETKPRKIAIDVK